MSAFHNNMLLGSAKTADLGDPIEQSLRFRGAQYLQNTNTLGNGTWTWSFWAKWSVDKLANSRQALVSTGDASTRGYLTFYNYGTDATYPSNRSLVSYSSSGTAYGIPGTLSGGYTDQKFADPSAWYHFVLVNKSSPDGCELWVNGVLQSDCNNPNNGWGFFGDDILIGGTLASSYYYSGYQADHYFIDGQALPPETFGRYNADGVWVPKTPTISSYGSNGFHLTFDSSQTNGIGHDSSGQGNHFSATGFDTTAISSSNFRNDIDYNDTPTSNYATFNPLSETPTLVVDGANLKIGEGGPSGMPHAPATIGPFTSGKYYMEFEASSANVFGVSNVPLNASIPASSTNNFSWFDDSLGWYPVNGAVYRSSSTYNAFGTAATSGDICAMAVDFDNGTVEYFNSGSSVGVATTTTSALTTGVPYYILHATMGGAPTSTNFGQRPFVYTPPTGYKALQTQNLPEPTIKDGSEHFRAIAAGPDQGVGAGERGGNWSAYYTSSTGAWFSGSTYNNQKAFDNNVNNPTATLAQTSTSDGVVTWEGFTPIQINQSLEIARTAAYGDATVVLTIDGVEQTFTLVYGQSYVYQQAFTGSGTLTKMVIGGGGSYGGSVAGIKVDGDVLVDSGPLAAAQAAFPDGLWWIKDKDNINQHQLVDSVRGNTIASQTPSSTKNTAYLPPTGNSVAWCWNSANPELSGFNIIEYTGDANATQAIAHGLPGTPEFIITGSQGATPGGYETFHVGCTPGKSLTIDSLAAEQTDTRYSGVDATNITYGSDYNTNGQLMIAYAWTSIPGYSAFGSYVGNNTADGPFVYTGFSPAFILIKSTSSGAWSIYDSTRTPYNPSNDVLIADSQAGEDSSTTNSIDFLSNGFKLRNANNARNGSFNYIYAAFAENPFGGKNTAPATAR